MNREYAYQLLTKYLKNQNLIKHCISCEAGMRAVCKKLHPDADEKTINTWGITGLLHDIDYELAKEQNRLSEHGLLIFEKEPNVIPEAIAHAIKAHNYENTKIIPQSDMDWAIAAVDQLTGLIIASALIHPASPQGGPDKKLASINTEFVIKRFNQPAFAKGANRKSIKLCEEKLNIPLPEFVTIVLVSMQEISTELGL